MSDSPTITEEDVANEFIEIYPDEDVGITTMFGRLAFGTASSMHAQKEDFDWIRNDPIGGTAYRGAVWQFLAVLWEKTTGEECKLEPEADKDAVVMLSVKFANIAFETYNSLSGGEYKIAQMMVKPDDLERLLIMEKTAEFYNRYLAPQFRLTITN